MPRYHFDRRVDGRLTRDDEGQELSMSEIRNEAILVLQEVAREVLPDGDFHTFKVTVRTDDQREVFAARLTLDADWTDDREMLEAINLKDDCRARNDK
jgi:hypothetical protein